MVLADIRGSLPDLTLTNLTQHADRAFRTLREMALAAAVAVIVVGIGLFAISTVQWPAFGSSNVTKALTTVGQVVTLTAVALAVVGLRLARSQQLRFAWAAKPLAWVGLSGFVTVTLGMPLGATKLYLHGISVDQEFRTQYLTRLSDSAHLADMTYADLPPFYPAGWFWIGGRVATILGMPGWEVFKPYAIGSIAVAAAVACVLWTELVRSDHAIIVATAVTAIVTAFGSPEPYGAVIALLFAPAMILAWGSLHRPGDHEGGFAAAAGVGLFFGLAATFYTLYFIFAVFAVGVMAAVASWLAMREHGRKAVVPVCLRLAAMALISGVIALTVWAPYLTKALATPVSDAGTATHYLPTAGAELPWPMLHFTLLGGLTLLGVLWLAVMTTSSRRAQALSLAVAALYLWSILSMAFTAIGNTLLSFRLEVLLLALLGAAGTFALLNLTGKALVSIDEPSRLLPPVVVVGTIGALSFSQSIPNILANEITTAYSDTDGSGVRADRRAPSAVVHYAELDRLITEHRQRERRETVVLTADTSFLAYYPYRGFQALTSHYANPLSNFKARAAEIKRWSTLASSQELVEALDKSPWRAPEVFLMRKSGDKYSLRLAEDTYPNDPNVRRYTVSFDKSLFSSPQFTVYETVGPFAMAIRNVP